MYKPYRGQRVQRHRHVRNIILILLALFLIAGTVFLLFFQDLIDIAGNKIAAIQKPATVQEASGDDTQTESSGGVDAAIPSPVAPKILEIPADKLADSAYLSQVQSLQKQGAITGAAIVVKNPDGSLLWKPAVTEVQNTAIDKAASDALPAAVKTLTEGGLPVTAVVYAYEDDMYSGLRQDAALMSTTGKHWRSPQGARRLSPASDAANAYLAALLGELRNMGCSEVMLRGYGWPATGNGRLDRVVYGAYSDAAARAKKLTEQLSAFQTVAQKMKLSVCIDDPTAPNGLEQNSGQDLVSLSPIATHLYVPMTVQTETSGSSIRTIIGKLPGAEPSKLVPMYTSAQLAKTLFRGEASLYFAPTETNGDIASYLAQ